MVGLVVNWLLSVLVCLPDEENSYCNHSLSTICGRFYLHAIREAQTVKEYGMSEPDSTSYGPLRGVTAVSEVLRLSQISYEHPS